ncbi:hypothetical protein COB11_01720 [Candidatus Aerophobetes bacterium]|uniref:HEAT repeat domain-containing protein n=1 Tax=Aerophobetes bacterium TaxID=2030807 RepID=A0A2A4YLD1_UNCAE|nr:MAG: hypothetical protein COB11_01720 [Candidatus Aerophobetes bacterium]
MDIPLVDTIDLEILMHRDVHFGGNFSIMLEYYEKDGVGTMPDFESPRIKKLLLEEEKLGQNLSEVLLPEQARERVEEAKNMYLSLRDIYEDKNTTKLSILISDLILSEENYPEKEIKALSAHGKAAVKPLVDLLHTDKLYDPLFPGYGRTPIFSAEVLSNIKDEKAIPPLFEAMGQENFFTDEAMIMALSSFGNTARKFLIRRMVHLPISRDNEHAAIVLTSMPECSEIANACLTLLKDQDVRNNESFANYLILGCSGLKSDVQKDEFKKIAKGLNGFIKFEMNLIAKAWD